MVALLTALARAVHSLPAMKKTIIAILCAAVLIMTGHADVRAGQNEIFASKSGGKAELTLDGVQGFVAGQTKEALSALMSETVAQYMSGAIEETARERGVLNEAGQINVSMLFAQNPELKEAVKQKIKQKLKDWMPGAVRDLVREHVFQNALGREHAQDVEQLLGYISTNFETLFNAQADNLINGWYTSYIGDIRRRVMEGTFTGWLDVTNLRGSIHDVLSGSSIMESTAMLLSRELGASTVSGIQDNLEAMLGGELPPAVVEYLEMGPEKFDELESYVREKIGAYLPSSYISRLQNSMLNRPLFRMPSGAYGAILAAMAAKHYAAAFKGVFVDPHEIKRGIEVTRVMVWQLREKEYLNVKLMDLAALSASFGSTLGMGAWQGIMNDSILSQLDKLGELSQKLDELIMKPFDLVGDQIRELTDQITAQLTALQNELMAPVQDAMAAFDQSLAGLANGAGGLLPDWFNGIPPDWYGFKETVGMGELFGEWGELTPRDLVERLGMMDDFELMGERLNELNDRIADAGAEAAAEILEELHLLGPASVLLGVEEVPARDPSDTSELDPVLLHNGEFVHRVTDVVIPGRGLDMRITRIYRSRSSFVGAFGRNWTHAYAERLLPWDGARGAGWTYVRPDGMKFFFKELLDGSFESPRDVFLKLVRSKKGFELTDPHGNVTAFYALGLLRGKRDTFGNRIRCIYNDKGWLMAVVGPLGRPVMFRYNEGGFVIGMEDIAGRTWAYKYDEHQNLVVVRSPVTAGFPSGKRTEYRYTSGHTDEALNHNLIAIMDPKGQLGLRNKYGTEGTDYDRVIEQRYGEREQRLYVQYGEVKAEVKAKVKVKNGKDIKMHPVASRAWVTDRRGVMHVYDQDAAGHLIGEWIVPEGYSPWLVGYYRYDELGRRTLSCRPSGRCVQFEYDDSDLLARGDIIAVREIPIGDTKPITTRIAYDKHFHKPVKVIDPLGNTNKYKYGDHGALVRACSSGADACSEFKYNRYGQLIEKIDARGVVTEYAYHPERDPDGNGSSLKGAVKLNPKTGGYLARVVVDARDLRGRRAYGSPVKSTTSFVYDEVGNIVRETNPLGQTKRYSVNALNQIVRERLPDKSERRYTFDANENLIRAELIKGDERVLREFEYDALDNLTARIIYPEPKKKIVTRYEYDASGNLIKTVLPEGNTIEIQRDAWGRVVCEVFGQQHHCIRYDADSIPVLYLQRLSSQTISLDGFGQWEEIVNPRETRAAVKRDLIGRITAYSVVNVEGELLKRGTLSYDAAGNVIKRSRAWWQDDPAHVRDVVERLEYDEVGNVVRAIDPRSAETRYAYDGLGNLTKIEYPTGVTARLERDAAGRVTARIVDGRRTSYEYDAAGNRVAVTDPLGARTAYAYSVAGDLVSTTDPNGNVTRYETDGVGRVMKVIAKPATNAADVVTTYAWDGNNRLTALVDPRGAVTNYTYDAQDRVLRITFPDDSTIEHTYLDSGATLTTDRAGNAMDRQYDDDGLLASLEVHDANGVLTLKQHFSYDGLGRLTDAVDALLVDDPADNIVIGTSYDSLGYAYAEWIGERGVERRFDATGNVTELVYPSGKRLQYSYDKASRLISVNMEGTRLWAQEYDGLWPVKQRWSNGITEDHTFDKRGRTVQTRLMNSGGLALDGYRYAYDKVGDLVKSERAITGAECSYRYDGMRRLVGSDCGGDSTTYKLDGTGSWTSTDARGNEVRWQTDLLNAYTLASGKAGTVSFAYDENGNLVSDGEHIYNYDPLGRLVEARRAADNAVVSHYTYDALGRRVRKEIEGKRVDVAFNGWNEIGEYSDQVPVVEFVNGDSLDQRLATMHGKDISFLHTDRLGSVVGITNAKGKLADAYTYDSYGKRYRIEGGASSEFVNPFAYTGRILDETGLMQYRYRYYHPLMGRFTSTDPLGYKNTQYAQTTGAVALALSYHKGFGWASQATLPNRSSHSMTALPGTYPFKRWRKTMSVFAPGEPNLYLYAAANPLSYIDPMGLAYLVFDRSESVIEVHAENEELWMPEGNTLWARYFAHNRTSRMDNDPLKPGSHAPAPNGTFAVSQPIFYDRTSRDTFYDDAEWIFDERRKGEGAHSGGGWSGDSEWYRERQYNTSMGFVRFRVGENIGIADSVTQIVFNRGIFIHGGRKNGRAGTWGCIRMDDQEIEDLAGDFIYLNRLGDPITHITLQD